MREMCGRGKSEQVSDFRDTHIGFLEQFFGSFDALVDDVLMRRVAGRLPLHPAIHVGARAQFGRP